MKKYIMFILLSVLVFDVCFGKLEVVSKKKDTYSGYPIYTIIVKNYNKKTDFKVFFDYAKEVMKKDHSDRLAVNLVLENEKDFINDRINLKNNKYLVLNPNGMMFEYTEKELLEVRTSKTGKNKIEESLNQPLKYDIADKKVSGISRVTVRVKLNRKSTSKELTDISRKIYREHKNNVTDPITKKIMKIDNMIIFYYLPKQNTNDTAYAGFEVVKSKINENFIRN
jgi:hypothetical protein|nr:MAG TPA_asm: hypothetical protein [Caudoviricetes sp.]